MSSFLTPIYSTFLSKILKSSLPLNWRLPQETNFNKDFYKDPLFVGVHPRGGSHVSFFQFQSPSSSLCGPAMGDYPTLFLFLFDSFKTNFSIFSQCRCLRRRRNLKTNFKVPMYSVLARPLSGIFFPPLFNFWSPTVKNVRKYHLSGRTRQKKMLHTKYEVPPFEGLTQGHTKFSLNAPAV